MRRVMMCVGALAVAAVVAPAGASASTSDTIPCGAEFAHAGTIVQYCPDWSPNNYIPVYAGHSIGSGQIGTIYAPGNDWYECQHKYPNDIYALGPYQNDWWAKTMADNGRWGWISEVYFRGGNNYEPDAGLNFCFDPV
jgi:hypothetical protein